MIDWATVVAAGIAFLGTILGAAITYFNQRVSSREAVQRLYYQHALEEKFTAFRDLYLAWDDTFARFRSYNSGTVTNVPEFQEKIGDPFRELVTKAEIASIYIDDEDDKQTIDDAIDKFKDQYKYLKSKAETYDEDHFAEERRTELRYTNEEMEDTYEEVKSILKGRIDPTNFEFDPRE